MSSVKTESSPTDVSPLQSPSAPSLSRRIPFFYGWIVLSIAGVANFASSPGQTYSFSVFLEHFRDDLELSSTLISSLYLVGTLAASLLIIPIGKALDIFGGRVMLVATGIAIGAASLWMSQVTGAVMLLIGFALLRTFGQGALSLIPTAVVSIWFVRRRAKALAIVGIGGAIAGGVFPILSNQLIAIFDWRGAWIAIAFIVWGLVIIPAWIFVRRTPESVGLLPDGDKRSSAGNQHDVSTTEEALFTSKQALRTRAMWMLMFAASAQSMVATGLMFHQISLLGDKGLSSTVAASVFGITAPAMIVGQFASGFLAEKFSLRYMITVGQLFITASVAVVFVISASWHAFVYGAMLGFTIGFLMNSMLTIWPHYYGRKSLGSIQGIAQFANMAASAAGPLPLAIFFDTTGSYTGGLVVFLFVPLICAVAAFSATKPKIPSSDTTG
ncbi:MFS transporter [Dehalococcoides mccartyi]|nr:MFS transporter [Dehalococcoides mccartyi]